MNTNSSKGFLRLTGCMMMLVALLTCGAKSEQSIYLIPENYEGNILIIFDQKDGFPTDYEESLRVYKIPESGIVHTRFKPNYGMRLIDRFYYANEDGQRTELKYIVSGLNEIEELNKSDVICFNMETGNDNNGMRHFLIFSVAQVQNADSITNKRSSFFWRVLSNK